MVGTVLLELGPCRDLESSTLGPGEGAGSAGRYRAACPFGGRERELSSGGLGEDGGFLRCVCGAGARAGGPMHASALGRLEGSLWGRGAQVPRGTGGSCPKLSPRSQHCGRISGGARGPIGARSVLQGEPFPPGAGRAGPPRAHSLLSLLTASLPGHPGLRERCGGVAAAALGAPASCSLTWQWCSGTLFCPRPIGAWPGREAAGRGEGSVGNDHPASSFFQALPKLKVPGTNLIFICG